MEQFTLHRSCYFLSSAACEITTVTFDKRVEPVFSHRCSGANFSLVGKSTLMASVFVAWRPSVRNDVGLLPSARRSRWTWPRKTTRHQTLVWQRATTATAAWRQWACWRHSILSPTSRCCCTTTSHSQRRHSHVCRSPSVLNTYLDVIRCRRCILHFQYYYR